METQLSKAESAMLATLRKMGSGWHNRAAIASRLGKKKLNALEAAALDQLVATGKIEGQLVQGARPNINQWQYRLPEGAK